MSEMETHCQQVQADPWGENWDDATRAHARACPTCIGFLECATRVRARLQDLPAANQTLPDELRAKMLAQFAECVADSDAQQPAGDRNVRRFPFRQKVLVPLTMAASLVFGVFLEKTFEFGVPVATEIERNVGMYIEDVTHDHYLLERIGRPLEVTITDAGELASWLSNSLSFAFELPSEQGPFSLQGGRVWHTVGRLSAMASYETKSGSRAILFAVPAANLDLEGAASSYVGDIQVFEGVGWGNDARVWIEGDLAMALTAPEGQLPAAWADVFLP